MPPISDALTLVMQRLEQVFGQAFVLIRRCDGQLFAAAARGPLRPGSAGLRRARQAAEANGPVLYNDAAPVGILALPLPKSGEEKSSWVAASAFVIDSDAALDDGGAAADRLGISPEELAAWTTEQESWSRAALLRAARTALAMIEADGRVQRMEYEVVQLSDNLADAYEEISILYQAADHLRHSDQVEQRVERLMSWLLDVLPAESVVWLPPQGSTPQRPAHVWGAAAGDPEQLRGLIDRLGDRVIDEPLVINPSSARTNIAALRQMILAPVSTDAEQAGWLVALNHPTGGQFGSHQARLLHSIAAILASCRHSGGPLVPPLLVPAPSDGGFPWVSSKN